MIATESHVPALDVEADDGDWRGDLYETFDDYAVQALNRGDREAASTYRKCAEIARSFVRRKQK